MKADVTVIGGGPGGYVAAIRAAQNGASVVLVEKNKPGGTCLNVGCIPTKALLKSAEIYSSIKEFAAFGIKVNGCSFDFSEILKRKNAIVNKLVSGVNYLIKKNKITLVNGEGSLEDKNTVRVKVKDGKEKLIKTDKIIIATGSVPFELPGFPFTENNIIDSTEALSLPEPPQELLIIGGGVIGLEFASVYNSFGSKVTIVEMMDSILPGEDREVQEVIRAEFEQRGIKIYTNSRAEGYEKKGEKLEVKISGKKEQIKVIADKVLVAVGRKPLIEGLGLEKIGVNFDRSGILVNKRMETSIPSIYAIGDVIGGYQLAHVASQEGIVAADNALGADREISYLAVPRCIYTSPEVAVVGYTEKEAKQKYQNKIKSGYFDLNHNGKTMIEDPGQGFVKVLIEEEYNQIIGMSIVGPHATELIGQGVLAVGLESTVETIDDLIFAHPTISEAIKEAVLDSAKKAIHQ